MSTGQPASKHPVVLAPESAEAANEDVVDSNVTVVNAMYAELLDAPEIAPNALRSYYVDFYLTQALAGGFAQYVFTVPEREEIDAYVREGLEGMGATAHLALFNRTAAAFDALSEDDADAYLDGDADGDSEGFGGADNGGGTASPEAVRELERLDDEFESLLESEDILALNAAWLRGQEGLLLLDGEQLELHIAERVARIPNLAERQAEAAEEALENAPEFELIIRELCDVAGQELQKITMGDPNYEHNGETVLAWHFTTDQGDFIMVEDDEEAYMISPSTKEIIAAVEFEEADA
ncbi:hypothetical protein Arth_3797 [Arthrobacter sp. FB24]|jgi:hypothetical protein|uniref:DMP19 family protein n=1 Tax=Arthrobacter sp. (strain FB24) TaxID=290399 RepID=UPI0000527601|nr:hypothetical protein [Arthrobacter sp. FB24]ABK05172.1 hypothetical protein Arth_3797 [Arthrobacter sp. FB24]